MSSQGKLKESPRSAIGQLRPGSVGLEFLSVELSKLGFASQTTIADWIANGPKPNPRSFRADSGAISGNLALVVVRLTRLHGRSSRMFGTCRPHGPAVLVVLDHYGFSASRCSRLCVR